MDMTQMIINDYLSHEVGANVTCVRFFLHAEYKLDRSQIDRHQHFDEIQICACRKLF